MSEILKLSDYRRSEKPTIPEQPIPLVETEKNSTEKLDPNEELVQVAQKNVELLKAKSKRKERLEDLKNRLVSPNEDYPNRMSPAVLSALKIIHRASGIFIADQIINGSAPKIDEIMDTSRSAYIHAEWPPAPMKGFINDRDHLESRRQEVADQMSSFINDHPEVTTADFEAAVLEHAENEYANDRRANYCRYGFGIEDPFAISQNVNIDYLKKVTEEDNAEGTVNYRLAHD